jgi:hypothetical protein
MLALNIAGWVIVFRQSDVQVAAMSGSLSLSIAFAGVVWLLATKYEKASDAELRAVGSSPSTDPSSGGGGTEPHPAEKLQQSFK